MINITNIHGGWLNLHIGDKSFCASYLTDVYEDIKKIFELEEYKYHKNMLSTILYFDGEGKELYLHVRREYNEVIIIWEEYDEKNNLTLYKMQFNYEDFKQEWLRLWNNIREDYWKNFDINFEKV